MVSSQELDLTKLLNRRRSKDYLDSLTACEELKTLHMSRCLSQYCVNNKLKSPLGKAQVIRIDAGSAIWAKNCRQFRFNLTLRRTRSPPSRRSSGTRPSPCSKAGPRE